MTTNRLMLPYRRSRRAGLFGAAALLVANLPIFQTAVAQNRDEPLDQSHQAWDGLLRRHVYWNASGTATSVSYKGFAADRAQLKTVLDQYSAVSKAQYEGLKRDEKLAFLINVYNAFTIELILTKYPELRSIKEIGGVFTKPWSIRFVKILGEEKHLDHVEHDMIRAPGVFDEPRIHFVVNCAAIGCPALRPEAITAVRLEAQLEDSTRRFLRDRGRNKFNVSTGQLEISKIFDWFRVDWQSGYRGITSREQFLAKYAELITDDTIAIQLIRDGKAPLRFLDYDWSLNDRKHHRP
jgi:hypothetical protein